MLFNNLFQAFQTEPGTQINKLNIFGYKYFDMSFCNSLPNSYDFDVLEGHPNVSH